MYRPLKLQITPLTPIIVSCRMEFVQTKTQYKFWLADKVTITMNNDYNFPMDPTDLDPASWSTPIGLSYHCSNFTLRENKTGDLQQNIVKLMFIDYQVRIV